MFLLNSWPACEKVLSKAEAAWLNRECSLSALPVNSGA
jgi:hypothetical protein